MNQYLSDLDTRRFGIVTVKADGFAQEDELAQCFSFCQENQASLLIARIDASKTPLTHAMERAGALLCDTLAYYDLPLSKVPKAPEARASSDAVVVREMVAADHAHVVGISKAAFSGYFGHYHSDPRLNKQDCDDTYVSWCASTLASTDPTNRILVAQDDAGVCGFLTMRLHEDARLELLLSGVDQRATGRGVYRRLIQAGVAFAAEHQLAHVFTSTQISNIAVQKVWCAQGFAPTNYVHTFHKWF
ncbi:hypothetical protein BA896_012440 [Janthinobacterium lividum]|uniref:N-acetyltransferase domain-containing protein n=1 Tax=Janthinobacterium lividum TaxID=29581 RepID=A0A1E8PVB4_9BURK|nr:hypothetical protein BA896_012440 [Janthinobacterium lividum]